MSQKGKEFISIDLPTLQNWSRELYAIVDDGEVWAATHWDIDRFSQMSEIRRWIYNLWRRKKNQQFINVPLNDLSEIAPYEF